MQVSLGAGGSERHVWGPQPYLMASLHARNFLFTEEKVQNFSGGSYSGVQLRQGRRRAYISGETSIAVGDILLV